MEKDLTIVIPTLNEEATIAHVITACLKQSDDVLVVDGHSTDDTMKIAQKLGVRVTLDQSRGRGKGNGLRSAIPDLNRKYTVFIDADGSHNPEDIPALVEPLQEDRADHVTGSRLLGGSDELHGNFNEFLRLTGSAFITLCINYRFGVTLSDSQCGFRAIRTDLLKRLALTENIMTIEQEMIMKTLLAGFRISEVPVHEYRREVGESRNRLAKVFGRYLWVLVKHMFLPRRFALRD